MRDGAWTPPTLITSARDYDYYKQPVLSADGSRLIYTGPFTTTFKSSTILFSSTDSPISPIQALIEPGTGGQLVSPDGRVDIYFSSGAVAVSTLVTYTTQPTPSHSPGNLTFAGTGFQLIAAQAGLPATQFTKPFTVTIQYDPEQILGLDPASLALYNWDQAENRWKDAADTCSPPSTYTRKPEQDRLSVGVCHLSEFALLGSGHPVFLPLLLR